MKLKHKKLIAAAVVAGAATGPVNAASGCPAVMDSIWMAAMSSGITSLINGIVGLVTGVSDQNSENEQKLVSALKVQTKQIATGAEKEATNTMQVMQAMANAMIDQDTVIQVQKVMESFGLSTGQGFDPCGEQQKSGRVVGGYNATLNVSSAVRSLDTGPGVYKDPGKVFANRMKEHKSLFCTPDEKQAGLCSSVGPLAGASLEFATLFKPSDISDNTTKAKDAFVNHIFGLPDQPIPKSRAQTPEAAAAIRDKMMMDGYRSIAATSLKAVQAMAIADKDADSTGTNNNGGLGPQGFSDALATKVDQYTGGGNYSKWEQSLTVQSERGLLVNLAKMSATKLYATSIEYDQYERMEANLAALLALENKRRGK